MSTILSRLTYLAKQFINREFRHSYVGAHTKQFLASQTRFLRGNLTQKAFARVLGTTQSVVSRYEDPEYGQVTLSTLLDIAKKLDVALVVRFVSFANFLRLTDDLSEAALNPTPFIKDEFNDEINSVIQIESQQLTFSPHRASVNIFIPEASGRPMN